jgi:hypothetical protein
MFPIGRPARQRYSRVIVAASPRGQYEKPVEGLRRGLTPHRRRARAPHAGAEIMSRPRSATSDPETERLMSEALSSCEEEWTILRTSSVNALIVGALHLAAAAVAGMHTSLRQPVVWWDSSQAPEPPELTAGTLVIRDVDRLEAEQQARLLRWMGLRRPAVQVLALARTPLIARVVDGRFAPELYYRMNTVLVEVRAQADLPSP